MSLGVVLRAEGYRSVVMVLSADAFLALWVVGMHRT
jgi:hypothetical protein